MSNAYKLMTSRLDRMGDALIEGNHFNICLFRAETRPVQDSRTFFSEKQKHLVHTYWSVRAPSCEL